MTTLTHDRVVLNPRTGKRLPAVSTCTAPRLMALMVDIATHHHAGGPAYLRWQICAFERIAELRRIPIEQAFLDWQEAVLAESGHLPPLL